MEGGLLIHAAFALSFTFVWVYRRWFEKTGPRALEFERFCASRPLLAALSVRPGTEAATLALLESLLPRRETLALHGGWPWIHYVLRVEYFARAGVVGARIAGCRVLKTREARPPGLTHVLARALHARDATVEQIWLCPGAYVDLSGRSAGDHGWRLLGAVASRPCSAWNQTPAWAHASRESEPPSVSVPCALPAAS